MCIISASVNSVSNTKIFVAPYDDDHRQIIVYSNEVDTHVRNNTMILPVPNPQSVELLDFSHYPQFFSDCAASFRDMGSRSFALANSLSRSAPSDPLPVFNVGSYIATIVPSVSEFRRLDTNHFTINDEVSAMLSRQYDPTFGFIVCKLRIGSHRYHPFAYTHYIHDSHHVFVPTYHYHPHGGGHRADWDHRIYGFGVNLQGSDRYIFHMNRLDYNRLPRFLQWTSEYRMMIETIQGDAPNRDLWLDIIAQTPIREPTTPPMRRRRQSTDSYEFPFDGDRGLSNIRRRFFGDD